MFPITRDPAIQRLGADERAKVERDAMDQLMARIPAEHRTGMTQMLAKPGLSISAAGDAEEARLLSIIFSARTPVDSEASASLMAPAEFRKEHTVVRIAMVSRRAPGEEKSRAVIRRSPDDNGMPLIVVPETAKPGDLERGVRAAIASITRDGRQVAAPSVVRLMKAPTPLSTQKEGASVH